MTIHIRGRIAGLRWALVAGALAIAACAGNETRYYSQLVQPGPVKVVGVLVAPVNDVGRPVASKNSQRGQSESIHVEDGQTHSKEEFEQWKAPMTAATVLQKASPAVSPKPNSDFRPLAIPDGDISGLAQALKAKLEALGYSAKILDFGSKESMTVADAIAAAKSQGCDALLAVQFKEREFWKTPAITRSSQSTTGNVTTTTTVSKWLNFFGVHIDPRVSLWSTANSSLLWAAGNYGMYKNPTVKTASKWAQMKHEFSEMGNNIKKNIGMNSRAAEKDPQTVLDEEWLAKVSDQVNATAAPTPSKNYQEWVANEDPAKREADQAKLDEIKAKLGALSAMLPQMAPMGDVFGQFMDKVQKDHEKQYPSRQVASAKAAENAANEIFTSATVSEESAKDNKPFPWAAKAQ
jgi:hypothetical protein